MDIFPEPFSRCQEHSGPSAMTSLCDPFPSGHWVFEGNGYILLIFRIPSTRHDPSLAGQGWGVRGWKEGFPGGADDKESACNEGDPDLIPGSGRSPGRKHGNALQLSCLENPMNRGTWWSLWGLKESDMTEWVTKTFPRQGRGFKALFLGDLVCEWGLKAGSAVYYLGDFK